MASPLTAPTEITGDKGFVKFGGQTINVTSWSIEPRVEEHDTSASDTAGSETVAPGMDSATGSVEANWRTNEVPHATPPNIRPGVIAEMELHLSNTGQKYSFTAMITNMPITSRVKNLVTYTFNFRKTGPITYPTGA